MGKKNNGNTDDDQFFLDQVLNGLYDFGGGTASKKQQKRKRTEVEEEDEAVAPGFVCVDTGDGGSEQRDAKDGQGKSQTDTSRSEPTGLPKHRIAQVEVVTYRDPAKKSKVKPTAPSDLKSPPKDSKKGKNNSDGAEEFTFEKARLEVHRFGIRGYEKEQQRSFEQERAIMLGAKPPKKDYINYKLLQQQVKEKKKAKVEVEPDLRKKKKQSKPRDKRKTSSGAVTGSGSSKLGQMGRFKDGMLILSSKDIDKIKGSKAK